jgi:hypothetical protein
LNEELSRLKNELSLANRHFIQLAEQVEPAKRGQSGVSGEWSLKDIISHLIGWDSSLCEFIANPDNFDPEPLYDVHVFNAKSVADRHSQTWKHTVDEMRQRFSDLEQALETVTPEKKMFKRVQSWLNGRIEDYHFHTEQLEGWLENE